jgi:hypothetical protein
VCGLSVSSSDHSFIARFNLRALLRFIAYVAPFLRWQDDLAPKYHFERWIMDSLL